MSESELTPQPILALGGLCTFLERSEVPLGLSPNCSDIEFRPKTILSRPGLGLRFTDESAFNSLQSFYGIDRVRRLLTFQENGKVGVETPEGVVNQIQNIHRAFSNNPPIDVGGAMKATYAFDRVWMCFSDAKTVSTTGMPSVRPIDFPMFYDPIPSPSGTFLTAPVNASAPPIAGAAASSVGAGLIAQGKHYFFYTFEDRYGTVTQQSPVGSFTAADSTHGADFSNIATGPFGLFGTTVRRRLWMTPAFVTGSGVAGFFSNGQLVIDNNVVTTLSAVSMTDATLQNGIKWETDNLTTVPPPPAIGVTTYDDRLVFWGVYPGIEPRLAKRIDGTGTDIVLLGRPAVDFFGPAGVIADWTTVAGAGVIVHQGSIYASVGTRTGSYLAFGVNPDHIYKDFPNLLTSTSQDPQYWLEPGKRYGFLVRIAGVITFPLPTITISMIGQSTGTTLASGTFSPTGSTWGVYEVDGVADVPSGETTIRFDIVTDLGGGAASFAVDWIRPYLQANKFDGSTLWIGDNVFPMNFDLTKSLLPVAPGDWQEIRCCFQQTGNLYIVKEHSTWVTARNGQDPTTWSIDNVSFEMGTPSVDGVALGPEFAIIAGREGIYRFDSGGIQKISQEIETTWQGVDWLQGHLLWTTVDPVLKVIRVAVPLKGGERQGVCHVILKCDYTEGWGENWATDQGTVSESGMRKWTIDHVETLCGEMAERDDGSQNLLVGGASVSSNTYGLAGSITGELGTRASTSAATGPSVPVGPPTTLSTQYTYAFSSGTARLFFSDNTFVLGGDYYVASVWAISPTAGVNISATLKDPLNGADVPIVITPQWQRFVAMFGPGPTGINTRGTLDIDFGTLTAPLNVCLFGQQIQHGKFDHGWTGAGKSGFGLPSGFLAQPVVYAPGSDPPWLTADWNALITPTYEIAPLAPTTIGRNTYGRLVARIRGKGLLTASYVLPDNSIKPMNGPVGPFPALKTNPMEDIEIGGTEQGTFVGIRLSLNDPKGWFALKRLALFTKPHEGSPFRGRS